LRRITVPTVILSSRDDPLVPTAPVEQATTSSSVTRILTERGGHVAFIGKRGVDPDRRWMDWRIIEWITRFTGDPSGRAAPRNLAAQRSPLAAAPAAIHVPPT
jgi:predicted alpha/beta-fold hydrolase